LAATNLSCKATTPSQEISFSEYGDLGACGHVTAFKTAHKTALKKSGVSHFVPYSLRHTVATELSSQCDVFTLAQILGHSSITITQRYVHPQKEAVAQAFERLDLSRGGHKIGHSEKKTNTKRMLEITVNHVFSASEVVNRGGLEPPTRRSRQILQRVDW